MTFTVRHPPSDCPLCGAEEVQFRFTAKGYRIFLCPKCTVQFVFPTPTEEQIAEIYSDDYFKRGNKYAASLSHVAKLSQSPEVANDESKIRLVQNYTDGKRLLDVGCALGGFLLRAKESGFDVSGVEYSESAAKHSREVHGLDVSQGTLFEAALPSESFDVVTMWDVIEHLADPHENLAEVSRLLKPGGILVMTTGDVNSLWSRLLGKYWQLMTPPQHLFYYSPTSLKTAIANQSLEACDIRYEGKSVTMDFLTFKARESFGPLFAPAQWLVKGIGIGTLSLKINLRDIMTFVAKRC